MADRSDERIALHYAIERELAARLRAAPANERARVYGEVYNELFGGCRTTRNCLSTRRSATVK